MCWGCGFRLQGSWAWQGILPAALWDLIHTRVIPARGKNSGCLLGVTQGQNGPGSESRVCTAWVVSSLGELGKGREGRATRGTDTGARRQGLAAGESQAGTDLAALWLPQASGQMTDLPILELS